MAINKITGLHETWNKKLGVAVVKQKNPNTIRLNGQQNAIHKIPIHANVIMSVYAKLKQSNTLVVIFSTKNESASKESAFITDALTLSKENFALLTIEDPTTTIFANLKKGWFLGDDRFDPNETIIKLIQKAISKSGASKVVLAGFGDGAFAALRSSVQIPGSCVFVDSADLEVEISDSQSQDTDYFGTAFRGESPTSVKNSDRTKYSIIELYRQNAPDSFVIIDQDLLKISEKRNRYRELKNLYLVKNAEGSDVTGRKQFRIYDSFYRNIGVGARQQFFSSLILSLSSFDSMITKYGSKIRSLDGETK